MTDARQLIIEADRIAREQGLNQAKWCRLAGFDEFGKIVSYAYKRGDCKLGTFIKLVKALGYEVRIVKSDLESRCEYGSDDTCRKDHIG